MAIIISGKIAENTIDILNYYFGNISSHKNNPELISKKPEGSLEKKIHIVKPGAVQSAIRIGSATINKRHPDYPGLKILDSILGGYFGSRLMKNIREEKGYTYGISSGVSSLDLTGYKVISTDVSPKNCQNALNEIYKEIRLLQNEPVKNYEMELVRNYMSGEMLRMFDGPFALAESFKSAWEFGLDNSYYYRLAEKIRSIDPDEITELARTYYNIDELYEVTVGQE
jgi:zinc protease